MGLDRAATQENEKEKPQPQQEAKQGSNTHGNAEKPPWHTVETTTGQAPHRIIMVFNLHSIIQPTTSYIGLMLAI